MRGGWISVVSPLLIVIIIIGLLDEWRCLIIATFFYFL